MKKWMIILPYLLLMIMENYAQENLKYQLPPPEILQLVDVKPQPAVFIDYDNKYMILCERKAFKDIEELAQPELRLAGLRINPETYSQSRINYFYGMQLIEIATGKELPIENLPDSLKMAYLSFSPDNKKIAFTNTYRKNISLWVVDIQTQQARMIYHQRMNACLGAPYHWAPDSESLLVNVVPENWPSLPIDKPLPEGPIVQETKGEKSAVRTYQDLLKNPYDENLFEHYATSAILKIGLDGSRQPFLPPAIYQSLNYSPDGKFILVSTIQKPFSYHVPYYDFSMKYAIHSGSGEFLHDFYLRPVVEDVLPMFDACEKGRRAIRWRSDKPAELCWVEALDKGDPRIETDKRDAIYIQDAHLYNPPTQIATTQYRFSGIIWGNDQIAVLNELWYKNRRSLTSFFSPANPSSTKKIVFDVSFEDLYADPGDFLTQRNEFNEWILRFSKNMEYLYLEGEGYSPDGNRPFLDELDVASLTKRRLWQAEGKLNYENILRVIDPEKIVMITSIESKYETPNLFVRTGKKLRQLTYFTSPYGDLQSRIKSEKIFYKRKDGVELSGTLYLPAAYDPDKDGPLPLLMWAYPREYKDANRAGQIKDSPHQFVSFNYGSPVFWALRGYAVLDEASFPIIGENDEEPNDTFIEQLVEDARAAIEYLAERGIADRERVAIGGHSYGAFMVANLLAHSDLFAAGIARSGAYNRTLTPFGFQSEERTFWEAPEVYLKMSPFIYADRIKSPLLLIHGEADNNSGTFTMQSERMFAAINGLGGTARLVILPFESHGYVARENILHTLWETDQWLEKYVKNKKLNITPQPNQE